jgi:hypothetical protein
MPEFTAEVLHERARLAMLDPEGERDAAVPLDGVKARQVLLHLAEPLDGVEARRIPLRPAEPGRPKRQHAADSGSTLNQRDILDRLGADPNKDHGMVRCPAHEDRTASLSWRWDGDRALVNCFGGCTFDEIRGAL